MVDPRDAGHFYDLRMRLRKHLSRYLQRMSAAQEDAWVLLNEVEAMVKLLERVEKNLCPDDGSEYAYKVHHTVMAHRPAWMAKVDTPSISQEKGPAVDEPAPH